MVHCLCLTLRFPRLNTHGLLLLVLWRRTSRAMFVRFLCLNKLHQSCRPPPNHPAHTQKTHHFTYYILHTGRPDIIIIHELYLCTSNSAAADRRPPDQLWIIGLSGFSSVAFSRNKNSHVGKCVLPNMLARLSSDLLAICVLDLVLWRSHVLHA